jgi:hypothetical protein
VLSVGMAMSPFQRRPDLNTAVIERSFTTPEISREPVNVSFLDGFPGQTVLMATMRYHPSDREHRVASIIWGRNRPGTHTLTIIQMVTASAQQRDPVRRRITTPTRSGWPIVPERCAGLRQPTGDDRRPINNIGETRHLSQGVIRPGSMRSVRPRSHRSRLDSLR